MYLKYLKNDSILELNPALNTIHGRINVKNIVSLNWNPLKKFELGFKHLISKVNIIPTIIVNPLSEEF